MMCHKRPEAHFVGGFLDWSSALTEKGIGGHGEWDHEFVLHIRGGVVLHVCVSSFGTKTGPVGASRRRKSEVKR